MRDLILNTIVTILLLRRLQMVFDKDPAFIGKSQIISRKNIS